jgi:Leucine-rich repeat (LRR) protein
MNRLGWHLQDLSPLTGLRFLSLSNNKLMYLHNSMWKLTEIEHLDLGHNSITTLPHELGDLVNLTVR